MERQENKITDVEREVTEVLRETIPEPGQINPIKYAWNKTEWNVTQRQGNDDSLP